MNSQCLQRSLNTNERHHLFIYWSFCVWANVYLLLICVLTESGLILLEDLLFIRCPCVLSTLALHQIVLQIYPRCHFKSFLILSNNCVFHWVLSFVGQTPILEKVLNIQGSTGSPEESHSVDRWPYGLCSQVCSELSLNVRKRVSRQNCSPPCCQD